MKASTIDNLHRAFLYGLMVVLFSSYYATAWWMANNRIEYYHSDSGRVVRTVEFRLEWDWDIGWICYQTITDY